MSNQNPTLSLDVDLQRGMVPISKAASSLAMLMKRAREQNQPIVITQKGYPSGVLLSIELFTALRTMAEAAEAAKGKATAGETDG
ncbi:MAG: type II toxin-antitoxin system prevent-host-death family antitoxin [Chloroflexia bacterium]|nr:type II toxin-antitoxin system prevent-host-death family antitoxin [Chloroflexia bacterium]